MTLEAEESDLLLSDVPESELFDISYLKGFKITLVNKSVQAEIIDLEEWKRTKNSK